VASNNLSLHQTCQDASVATTVLIVDDHDEFRAAAVRVLVGDGFEVVGEAGTGVEALEAIARLRPVVVVLDIRLPDVDGIELAGLVAEMIDPPHVVLTSSRSAAEWGPRLDAVHCQGFLPKVDLSGAALRRLIGCPI
jgi:DNA-binding NarL/FixJ family response regulator